MLDLEDDYKYIQKDINNTHFVYLGTFAGDLSEIVRLNGGNSVDITDVTTINNSQLFGKKVTKITMPSYKNNLKELMVVTFENNDSRFIQADRDYYNQLANKLYVKQLFGTHY